MKLAAVPFAPLMLAADLCEPAPEIRQELKRFDIKDVGGEKRQDWYVRLSQISPRNIPKISLSSNATSARCTAVSVDSAVCEVACRYRHAESAGALEENIDTSFQAHDARGYV